MADAVATILFGAPFPWSQMIIAQARLMGQSGGKSTILSTGASVSPSAAALAHGAMTHAFEQDNITFPDSGRAPGCGAGNIGAGGSRSGPGLQRTRVANGDCCRRRGNDSDAGVGDEAL